MLPHTFVVLGSFGLCWLFLCLPVALLPLYLWPHPFGEVFVHAAIPLRTGTGSPP